MRLPAAAASGAACSTTHDPFCLCQPTPCHPLSAFRSVGLCVLVTVNRWLVLALEEEEKAEAEVGGRLAVRRPLRASQAASRFARCCAAPFK